MHHSSNRLIEPIRSFVSTVTPKGPDEGRNNRKAKGVCLDRGHFDIRGQLLRRSAIDQYLGSQSNVQSDDRPRANFHQ